MDIETNANAQRYRPERLRLVDVTMRRGQRVEKVTWQLEDCVFEVIQDAFGFTWTLRWVSCEKIPEIQGQTVQWSEEGARVHAEEHMCKYGSGPVTITVNTNRADILREDPRASTGIAILRARIMLLLLEAGVEDIKTLSHDGPAIIKDFLSNKVQACVVLNEVERVVNYHEAKELSKQRRAILTGGMEFQETSA